MITATPTSTSHPPLRFAGRYGPWALVAGASEGLGAEYARALAARGLDLVLVARRRQVLEAFADGLRSEHGIKTLCLEGDLAEAGFLDSVLAACSDVDLGLVVYNAAHAPVAEFASLSPDDVLRVVDVNVRGPLILVRGLLPGLVARGRGGIILMTSLAGNQGSPYLSVYAASKAFNRVLAEGLWHELKGNGVDVLACMAGAVRTPGYVEAATGNDAPGTLDATEVVEAALRALGHGPVVIPGRFNRLASFFMTRVLPRRRAIGIMARNIGSLSGSPPTCPSSKDVP